MSLWNRRKQLELAAPNVPADWIESHAWCEWESPKNFVIGESHYQDALAALCGPLRADGYCRAVEVMLIREPNNPYDHNRFRAEIGGQLVGHLRKELAAQIAPLVDKAKCRSFGVAGVVRGGWPDAPNFGCHLWLHRRTGPGPEIVQLDDAGDANWPPRAGELHF